MSSFTPPQVIRADEAYSVSEFRRRAGLGDFAFRQARADGLAVIAVGKKRYVRGEDWLDYLSRKYADASAEPRDIGGSQIGTSRLN